jgi:hypothetical protein
MRTPARVCKNWSSVPGFGFEDEVNVSLTEKGALVAQYMRLSCSAIPQGIYPAVVEF